MPNEVAGFELWCGKERIGRLANGVGGPGLARGAGGARFPLGRGQLLSDADIVLERRDVLEQHEACIRFPVTDNYLELNAEHFGGHAGLEPLRSTSARWCGAAKWWKRVFQDGNLIISLKVETLEDGAFGQTVRVRNPKTKREFYGKVQNEDLVLITL